MVLFRYLLTKILKNVFFILVMVAFFAILFDFIHKSWGYLDKYEPSAMALVSYYFYWLPLILQQFLPVALAFGVTFVVIAFSRSNELSAMMALGASYRSLLLPFLCAGCIFSMMDFDYNLVFT